MANGRLTLLLLIFCFIIVHEVEIYNGHHLTVAAIDCPSKCSYRCSKSGRHKMCMRACKTCCQRCNCVPPGTAGNENVCPCYANMKTHGGRHKCP
ncbi:gibberellin-regulated protein 2-like [Ipomoea triloba]|uniref:gibberellin-regulated protein 2-like n=1 Tax=Ipomoea triloba TaxID=35885 RepID=UPI00125D8129|nr:gibberellin-regulated protein 2-like [Ipomoea triloba]